MALFSVACGGGAANSGNTTATGGTNGIYNIHEDGGGGSDASAGGGGSCVDPGKLGPCTGGFDGDLAGVFTCENRFANYGGGATTRFGLQDTATGLPFVDLYSLNFLGEPQAGTQVMMDSSAAITLNGYVPGPDGGTVPDTLQARAGKLPLGTITLNIDTVEPRQGGTPGDLCLHGSLTATLLDLHTPPRAMAHLAVDF
jgi:hypothetical protein